MGATDPVPFFTTPELGIVDLAHRQSVGRPLSLLVLDGWRQDGIFKGLHRKLDFGRIQFNAVIYGVFVWDPFPSFLPSLTLTQQQSRAAKLYL